MASLISFFILLLTAYTFAVPIGQENSTIGFGWTTEQTTVGMNVTSNNLSTAVPIVQKQRAVEDSSSIEVTTGSVARTARKYDQKYKPTYGKVPKTSLTKRNGKSLSDSTEYQGAGKRDFQKSLIPTSSKDYKKRSDSASQESFIQTTPAYKKRADSASQESLESISSEKRESVLPTTTQGYKKRSKAASQESLESTSSEKRESKEALIPTVTTGYKKREDSASQESLEIKSKEKRESVIPTTTSAYKKRSKAASQESLESTSSEKRESKEALIPTVTTGYKKREDSASQESPEIKSKEKRESVIPTTTQGYKKRSKDASQESLEINSSEKRESVYSTTPDFKKRADSESEESLESSSTEKRANRNLIQTTTPVSKTITPKSYLFTTLESSTVFNRRAIPPVESQEEPESGNEYPEQKMKMSSGVKPSSSVHSFGKPTRPLNNEPIDQSSEESQSQLPIQTQKITKTVSVIPGKVRKTEVVPNVPSKSSSMMQPPQEEQLSQGQSQSESEKRKRDY